ncbi:hypothetical protein SDC9_129961 [bioreactor metagenome]|uniref:Uncharacterized protein n=1 Tax=bioreactor metagenome TaxID=1076179 RepID=A0A645D145_9ZZZZ
MDISYNVLVFPKSGYYLHILSDFGNALYIMRYAPVAKLKQGPHFLHHLNDLVSHINNNAKYAKSGQISNFSYNLNQFNP